MTNKELLPHNLTLEREKQNRMRSIDLIFDPVIGPEAISERSKRECSIAMRLQKYDFDKERKKWKEERKKLMKELEEERALNVEYTTEMSYHRKLSKLEDRIDKLEEERKESMKDVMTKEEDKEKIQEKCKKLEEEKEEMIKVVEEFKSNQQLWEHERNHLLFLMDSQRRVIEDFKNFLYTQCDLLSRVKEDEI